MVIEESLVEQIQNDILDLKIPLANIMRKALILSYSLKSTELRNWVERELNGYQGVADNAPDYRKYRSPVMISTSNAYYLRQNQPAPYLAKYPDLDEELQKSTMTESIGALEALIEGKVAKPTELKKPLPAYFLPYITEHLNHGYVCIEAWTLLPPATIAGILDSARTRLLHFVQEIKAISPDAERISAIGRSEPDKVSSLFYRCVMNSDKASSHHFEDIRGSVIATDNAKISSSSATYQVIGDIGSELEEIRRTIEASSEQNDEAMTGAIGLLIRALDDTTVPKSQVAGAVEVVAGRGVWFREKLMAIGGFVAKKTGEVVIKDAVGFTLKTES